VNNDDRVFTMRFQNTGLLLGKFLLVCLQQLYRNVDVVKGRLNVCFQVFTMAIAKMVVFEGL
jgi:hypothetical protein